MGGYTTKSGDLYWYINAAGMLAVSGSGDYEKSYNGKAPWLEYADQITSAVVSVKNISDMMGMFEDCRNMTAVTFKNSDTSKMKEAMSLFDGCEKLTDVDLRCFSTETCTNISNMFYNCKALERVDLSRFKTSEVYNMHYLFYGCSSLKEADVSSFTFENCTNFNYWLEGCYSLEKIKVPANMFQAVDLPTKNYWYWSNDEAENCTEIVTGLDHELTYYKHKPILLATGFQVTLKNSELTYGQSLSELEFDEVSFIEKGSSNTVTGKLGWKDADAVPYITDTEAEWIFIPDDEIYDSVEGKVDITVNKITDAPGLPESQMNVSYNTKKVGQIPLNDDWEWRVTDKDKELTVGVPLSATAEYKGADAEVYENISVNVTITRNECTHADLAEHKTTAVAATCEKDGNIAYYTCPDCGRLFSDEDGDTQITEAETVKYATGHTASESVRENEVAAACETAGSYEEVVYCSVCGEELSRESKSGEAALGHSWNEGAITTEPTCTEKGVKTFACARCDKTRIEEVDEQGHSYGAPIYIWSVDGKACTAKVVCTRCDDIYAQEQAVIESRQTKAPTYTDKGETTYTAVFDNDMFETKSKTVADIPVLIKQKEPVTPGGGIADGGNTQEGNSSNTSGNSKNVVTSGESKTTESDAGTGAGSDGIVEGKVVIDEKTGALYTVISTGKTASAAYNAPKNKNLTKVNILAKVTIDNTEYKVTEIKDDAFKNNKKLKQITIEKNVKSIGKNAFNGCKNLKNITIKTTLLSRNTVGKNAFKGISTKAKVKVPKNKLKEYKAILKTAGIKGKKQKITK